MDFHKKKPHFMKYVVYAAILVGMSYAAVLTIFHRQIDRWDWSEINVEQISFPDDFIWGTASASFQVEGGHGSFDSWGWWETQTDEMGRSLWRWKRFLESFQTSHSFSS